MRLTSKQLRIFPRIQRKYNVSVGFLKSNIASIEKFLWYALCPRLVIKRVAIRKGQRIVLDYYHLRRVLFDKSQRKMIKTRKRNVQQWSRRMVCYLRNTYGVKEFVETVYSDESPAHIETDLPTIASKELSKQLKEQLELLKSSRPLVEIAKVRNVDSVKHKEIGDEDDSVIFESCRAQQFEESKSVNFQANMKLSINCNTLEEGKKTDTNYLQNTLEKTPTKQIVCRGEESTNFDLDTLMNCKFVDNSSAEKYTDEDVELDENAINMPLLSAAVSGEHKTIDTAFNKEKLYAPNKAINFLDMLMNKMKTRYLNNEVETTEEVQNNNKTKVSAAMTAASCSSHYTDKKRNQDCDVSTDSSEDFLGFDETERLPGMLLTPLVPACSRWKDDQNTAFVSESLNEYMRQNELETSTNSAKQEMSSSSSYQKQQEAASDGLVTPTCVLPYMDMPFVPESLQRLRTVAERRQYLQKFGKNHKLAIINNEAMIYRELQRKTRLNKSKSVSQQLLQAPNSQMPFTRNGWQAASFVTTEFNKYYYQMLNVDNDSEIVKLPGVRGNNEERNKRPYLSRVPATAVAEFCSGTCVDSLVWRDLKPIKTCETKRRLNKAPLRSVFKPCPLSHKPFQKPLDDETAALLLAGGSMAVVRMPTVELQVYPEVGKPLDEIAKRYLQYILPHHDISREWAEFSVSTLQQEANTTATDVTNGRRKSFAFAIPYLNDRNHILVRRVVDRSEKLDESFEQAKVSESDAALADLSFRTNLDKGDNMLMDCADVITDMINSVAISCSENSFIKEDPDILYDKKTATAPEKKPLPTSSLKVASANIQSAAQNKKQNRLLLELRRLNATIIDAAVKAEKEIKPCKKEYCALGCVCASLADDYPLRQHCGRVKCVIECTCKGSNQSRIMRLETDGRSITTEDAFMLRRQATARLARMEKEFTSTIVLTENETLLINESQYEKKRRCTKAPKRYEDFADTDDDFTRTSPVKKASSGGFADGNGGGVVSIEAAIAPPDTTLSSNTGGYSEITTKLRESIYVKDTILEQLKHCTVTLVPLEDTKNMAVWCMVHELYKCFCGGRSIEGKPLIIDIEGPNETIAPSNSTVGDDEEQCYGGASKVRYSFEKMEEEIKEIGSSKTRKKAYKGQNEEDEFEDNSAQEEEEETSSTNEDTDVSFEAEPVHKSGKALKSIMRFKRGRPSEEDYIQGYFNAEPSLCRRVIPVPTKSYVRFNRKRAPEVIEYIMKNESGSSRLLLNEHILRSVYYHKHELEKQRKEEDKQPLQQHQQKELRPSKRSNKELPEKTEKNNVLEMDKSIRCNENIVELIDDDSRHSSIASSSSEKTIKRGMPKKSHRKGHLAIATATKVTKDSFTDQSKNINELVKRRLSPQNNNEDVQRDSSRLSSMDIPKISGCFSLNSENSIEDDTASNASVTTSTITESSQAAAAAHLVDEMTTTNDNFKEFYNSVIKHMNNLVSKKMQDIEMALKRESKVIPAPNEEILCIIKWTNFLSAFHENFVFIWEVKMRNYKFFAATITNMMPLIPGAMGVVNITTLDLRQLPLMGRMLLQHCNSEKTHKLAIVMQGRTQYWLVKGFLRADGTSACAKPTPRTHPLLARKINILCNLLVKQRVSQRKLQLQQQKEAEDRSMQIESESQVISTGRYTLPNARSSSFATHSTQETPELTGVPNHLIGQRLRNQLPQIITQTHARKHKGTEPITPQLLPKRAKIFNSVSPSNTSLVRELTSPELFANMKTNLEFRQITQEDIAEIHQPEYHREDHLWLVLDLYNDFSHIFVPDFQDLVSLDRIQKVMAFSRQKNKIVKLQFFQNAPFDAFVTPISERKIYFGPLKVNVRPPLLILLQSVDGDMMVREMYQQTHNIQSRAQYERTTAFWILQKNGVLHYGVDAEIMVGTETEPRTMGSIELIDDEQQQLCEENDNSDEDCVIVEDEEQVLSANDVSRISKPTQQSKSTKHGLNFSIQAGDNPDGLKITSIPNEISTTMTSAEKRNQPLLKLPSYPTSTCVPADLNTEQAAQAMTVFPTPINLPPNAVITSVAAAPQEAPYAATIYISNQLQLDNASSSRNHMPIGTTKVTSVLQTQMSNSQGSSSNNNSSNNISITTTKGSSGLDENISLTSRLPVINCKDDFNDKIQQKMFRAAPFTGKFPVDSSTTAVPVSGIGTASIPKVCNRNAVKIACKDINSLLKPIPPPVSTLPTVINSAQQATVTTAAPSPTYITPDVQVTATTESIDNNVGLTTAPINQRRVSVLCSNMVDNETTNLVLDAVLKMLPDSHKITDVTEVTGMVTSGEGLPPTHESNIASNHQIMRHPTVSTIGCTTITKLSDTTATYMGRIPATVAATTLPLLSTESPLTQAPLEPTAPSVIGTDSPQMVGEVPVIPMVFDINFMDGQDEPSASIVIKPSLLKGGNTTANPSSITNPNSVDPVTGVISIHNKMFNRHPNVVKTPSTTMRLVRPATTAKAAATSFVGSSDENISSTAISTNGNAKPDNDNILLSPMELGSRKNFNAVTTTPLNFNKLPSPTLKFAANKPTPIKVGTVTSCASSVAGSSKPSTSTRALNSNNNKLQVTGKIKIRKNLISPNLTAAAAPLSNNKPIVNANVAASSSATSTDYGTMLVTVPRTTTHLKLAKPPQTADPLKLSVNALQQKQQKQCPPLPTTTATTVSATAAACSSNSTATTATPVQIQANIKPIINVRPAIPGPQRRSVPSASPIRLHGKSLNKLSSSAPKLPVRKAPPPPPTPPPPPLTAVPPPSSVRSPTTYVPISARSSPAVSVGVASSARSSSTASPRSKPITIRAVVGGAVKTHSSKITTVHARSPMDAQYGFFCCNIPGVPKFVVKRIKQHYLIKVPDRGILQMDGLENVNAYLNKYLLQHKPNLIDKLPVTWKFSPQQMRRECNLAKRVGMTAGSIQTHTQQKMGNIARSSMPTQKSASANNVPTTGPSTTRITATTTVTTSTSPSPAPSISSLRLPTMSVLRNKSKAVINATAAASINVHSDTILIDD